MSDVHRPEPLTEAELAVIEERSNWEHPNSRVVRRLIADLRASRAEVERLRAEIERMRGLTGRDAAWSFTSEEHRPPTLT